MPKRIPRFLINFMTRLKALYGKDMGFDDSHREGYDFVAFHYHWYNRYAEDVCSFDSHYLRHIYGNPLYRVLEL